MKIVITGATGFIGRHLSDALVKRGDRVIALTRNPERATKLLPPPVSLLRWNTDEPETLSRELSDCNAVVNLAGENLSAGRWTEQRRKALLQSRLDAIHAIGSSLPARITKPLAIIQGSAVGFYGPRGEEALVEDETVGTGYLAEIAATCERTAIALARPGIRVVSIRTGIVLGRTGGFLPLLLLPIRLWVGGFPGTGAQWLSWIHIEDEVRAIIHLIDHTDMEGVFNLTAPEPLPMRNFVKEAGGVLHRPVWFPLPAPLLRIVFGEMADEALLTGQRAIPSRLREAGFVFNFKTAASALRNLLV